jgi:hypothetical protein
VLAKQMPVVDAAHFIALVSVAESDAIIAVFDAKYAFQFCRSVLSTGCRDPKGDIDGILLVGRAYRY